jgi:Putative zincin peptidase
MALTDLNSSTQTLPDGYTRTVEINLSKNKGLAILLNIVGLIISILAFVLMALFTRFARPGSFAEAFIFKADLSTMGQLLVLVVLITVSLVVHELIHGFFFWAFTRSRPVYALHLAYAYAAAPGWYIPLRQYWVIGLSPLVLIDLAGLLLILLASPAWILLLVFLVAFNTGGSVGDLWIILNSLLKSPACLVNDVGDGVTFFEPFSRSSNLP